MNDMVKNLLLWLVIAAVLLSVFQNFNMQGQPAQVGYSELIQQIHQYTAPGSNHIAVMLDGFALFFPAIS